MTWCPLCHRPVGAAAPTPSRTPILSPEAEQRMYRGWRRERRQERRRERILSFVIGLFRWL